MERAFTVHKHMMTVGIKPTVVTFNALITACRHMGEYEGALEVLRIMKDTEGCEPDVISYSTVIDTLGRRGRLKEISDVLTDMKERGIEPNLVTYTSVVSARTRARDFSGAMEVLAEMEARDIQPNVYTYSSLINGAGRAHDFEKAFELLDRMRKQGINATVVTYVNLIQSAFHAGNAEYFRRAIEALGEADIIGDATSYKRVRDLAYSSVVVKPGGHNKLDQLVNIVRTAAKDSSWGTVAKRRYTAGRKHVNKYSRPLRTVRRPGTKSAA